VSSREDLAHCPAVVVADDDSRPQAHVGQHVCQGVGDATGVEEVAVRDGAPVGALR
jgi:hypothetical protein